MSQAGQPYNDARPVIRHGIHGWPLDSDAYYYVMDILAATRIYPNDDTATTDHYVFDAWLAHVTLAACARTCRAWYRHATLRLYQTVVLNSPARVRKLSMALVRNPSLASLVSRAVLSQLWDRTCVSLLSLFAMQFARRLPRLRALFYAYCVRGRSGPLGALAVLALGGFGGLTELPIYDRTSDGGYSRHDTMRTIEAPPNLARLHLSEMQAGSRTERPLPPSAVRRQPGLATVSTDVLILHTLEY